MITVTEEARDLFREIDNPDGTVLRLDPVTTDRSTDEIQVRLGVGEPRDDDQVVQHGAGDAQEVFPYVSEVFNGSIIDLVETLEGPALGIKPPDEGLPLTDGA